MQTLRILLEVGMNPGIAVYDLAERTGCSGASASRNVTRLGPGGPRGAGLGLVHRYEDPMDRRNKRVQLTDKGQRLLAELGKVMGDALSRTNTSNS